MKNDHEVLRMRRERSNGKTQAQAAARAGMSVRTARHYARLGQLPSQTKQPRTHCTRPNPFAGDWAWVVAQLERDAALQAKTRFAELVQRSWALPAQPTAHAPAPCRQLARAIRPRA